MTTETKPHRQLGLFDATMIVMGGIVGAGIFANPSEVAHRVHTPFLILGVWVLGGLLAMCGAFIWAELATRLPGAAGGQYVYLRDAYHPAVAFVYGWGLLLVTQTGGMAAVAVIFASYFRALTGVMWNESAIAAAALLTLTGINCFGARAGSNVQSVLMLLKIVAIAALVIIGFAAGGHAPEHRHALVQKPFSFDVLKSIGAAMVPIAFAYGGWQTATFVAAEIRDPRRNLSRGLLLGVAGVVMLYLAVNRRVFASARSGWTRCNHNACIGSYAHGAGRKRRPLDRVRDHNFRARIPQPKHAHRSARVLRDGSRRTFLF